MKITVRQLREIIKEEVKRNIFENRVGEEFVPPPGTEQLYQEILEEHGDLLGFVESLSSYERWNRSKNEYSLSAILEDYPSGFDNGDVCLELATALMNSTDLFV